VCHPAAACEQGAHVTAGLGAMQRAERQSHLRDVEVSIGIGRDDEKQSARRAAFVQLPVEWR